MPNKIPGNVHFDKTEEVLTSYRFLERYLEAPSILAFSHTCQVAKGMSHKALLMVLLTAVALKG